MAILTSDQLVLLTITLPLWSIGTIYLLILLICYLRSILYFRFYDKCTNKNAHFRYDFTAIFGKYSNNFNPVDANVMIDLLDNQSISVMTIQVPVSTILSDKDAYLCRRSTAHLQRVVFSVYRKNPLKEVKSIRVAHSSPESDAKIIIYGLQIKDSANKETKFFPITSVVRHRGSHWALNTTFESKIDTGFNKMGVDQYDMFEHAVWPTSQEIVYLLLYIWSSVFFFAYLISIETVGSQVTHGVTIFITSCVTAFIIGFVYLKIIKPNANDSTPESNTWQYISLFYIDLIVIISVVFCVFASKISQYRDPYHWIINTTVVSLTLTSLIILIFVIALNLRSIKNRSVLRETDAGLMKAGSGLAADFVDTPNNPAPKAIPQPLDQNSANSQSAKKAITKSIKTSSAKGSRNKKKSPMKTKREKKAAIEDDAIDSNKSEGMYIKTKNRNSISQYV